MKMSAVAALILTSTLCAQSSFAQNEEVNEAQLKLAGRGFTNRTTRESMALACVGKTQTSEDLNCNELRLVYFNPVTQKAFYLGQTYSTSQFISDRKATRMNDDQKRQYAIKQMMKNFKRWRRSHQQGMSSDAKNAITGAAFIGVLLMEWVASSVASGGLSIALTVATYPFYLVLTPIITGDLKIMNGNQKMTSASFDRQGWNWSSEPIQVRDKVFKLLIDYFSMGSYPSHEDAIRAGVTP